jgi:hypothetical protein
MNEAGARRKEKSGGIRNPAWRSKRQNAFRDLASGLDPIYGATAIEFNRACACLDELVTRSETM